jgi:diguanylate cyclase (GGDEF)-like protein
MHTGGIPDPMGWEDPLSGLEGPDFWRRILVAEIARSARYKRPMTVVLIDLEGVSEVFDAMGDEAARRAVREAAQCLRRVSRTSDYCTRIDTLRFGVVLTETDEIAAINFVDGVRDARTRTAAPGGSLLQLRFGWASPRPRESARAVVRRADGRLLADVAG